MYAGWSGMFSSLTILCSLFTGGTTSIDRHRNEEWVSIFDDLYAVYIM